MVPRFVWDHHPVATPKTPEEGYHLSVDLVDKAILFLANHESVAPKNHGFFGLLLAHAMHHTTYQKNGLISTKEKFDKGWDKIREETLERQKRMGIVPENTELAPPNEGVQKWDDLSADEKRLFARMMECYAGFLSHTDNQIGRLIAFLEKIGKLENTLCLYAPTTAPVQRECLPVYSMRYPSFNAEPESVEKNLKRIDELVDQPATITILLAGPWQVIRHLSGTNNIHTTVVQKIL